MDFFLLNKQQVQPSHCPERNGQLTQPIRTDMNDSIMRKGNYIKMIYKEKGGWNMYKGYIGEIRQYRKGQDFAMIILHAMANMKLMKVPIEHFIKID